MEVITALGASAVHGLMVWSVEDLRKWLKNEKLNVERLGEWKKVIFSGLSSRIILQNRCVHVPIIWDPEIYEKERIKRCEQQPDELGTVCWRSLINHIYDEPALIEAYKNHKEDWFYSATEIAGYRDNVAARVTSKTMYRYIFSNLHPKNWKKIILGKEQRISTCIGEISSLYYQNMRWFHYTPCRYPIDSKEIGEYRNELDLLLKQGHTIRGLGFENFVEHLRSKEATVPWMNINKDVSVAHKIFEANISGYSHGEKSVFNGGVVTPELEPLIAIVLVNMISVFVACIVERKVGSSSLLNPETLVGKQMEVYEDYEKLRKLAWFADTYSDLEEAILAASAVAIWYGESYDKQNHPLSPFDEENRKSCFSLVKAIRHLNRNFHVIEWDRSDWKQLESYAWLAGTEDSAGGGTDDKNDKLIGNGNQLGAQHSDAYDGIGWDSP